MNQYKIMIVEDESIPALDVKFMLNELGYIATEFIRTGEEAIRQVEQLRPDLVLMDITLAGNMSGIEAGEWIQKNFSIPVVFLTAHADMRTMEDAEILKPYGYLIKPVTQNDLDLTLSSALQRKLVEEKKKKKKRL